MDIFLCYMPEEAFVQEPLPIEKELLPFPERQDGVQASGVCPLSPCSDFDEMPYLVAANNQVCFPGTRPNISADDSEAPDHEIERGKPFSDLTGPQMCFFQ